MSDGIAVEGSRAGAVRQNTFVGLRMAAGAERAEGSCVRFQRFRFAAVGNNNHNNNNNNNNCLL